MTASATVRRRARPARDLAGRDASLVPPEEELLLLSAGGASNDATMRAVIDAGIDWQRFLGLTQLERAVPVVYARLRTVAGASVPPAILDQMRRLAMVSDFAMLHLESRLRDSLHAFDDARLRVMLLKGAALAHTAYAGARQRPMSDLDILVDPTDASTARQIMLATGWRDFDGAIPLSVYDHHHHLPPLHDSRSPELQLEIHTALFPERQPFRFRTDDLWSCARPLAPGFPNAYAPDPIHSLLHACLHFLWSHQGRFGAWRTIRDVDALTRAEAIDWDAFVNAARSARGATACYWTLRIADVTASVRVPAAVVDALRPGRNRYLLQALERHLVRNLFPVQFECPSVALDHALWELAVMPRKSGHGDIRPWDEEGDFLPPPLPSTGQHSPRRRSRVGPALRYLAGLLRT